MHARGLREWGAHADLGDSQPVQSTNVPILGTHQDSVPLGWPCTGAEAQLSGSGSLEEKRLLVWSFPIQSACGPWWAGDLHESRVPVRPGTSGPTALGA